jgi:hypothetical protein
MMTHFKAGIVAFGLVALMATVTAASAQTVVGPNWQIDREPVAQRCGIAPAHIRAVGLTVIDELKRESAQNKAAPAIVIEFLRRTITKLDQEMLNQDQDYRRAISYPAFLRWGIGNPLNLGNPPPAALDVAVTCFPELKPLVAEQQVAVQAETARLQEEAKRRAEAQAAARIEAAKPQNRLFAAYNLFAKVQFCSQVRDGYAAVYISGPEYDRSHDAVKAVERATLAEQPDLNTTDIWQQAVQAMKRENWYADSYSCSNVRVALYKMSPKPVYQYPKP